ncbi:MAG: GNAT family N-acetyltransferase [Leptolyngbyaceae cyanobacterium SL_1_1]|nr:GNAT family N-acetyltransferase [Leptolyngbyaceae cyanobacterium SL_1_1]
MQISTYQAKYKTSIVDLILLIQREEFGSSITLADQPDLLDIPAVYQWGNGNFWVALEADEVIGTIAAIDIGNQQLVLRKMFVAAPHRGRKKGVGKQLLDSVTRKNSFQPVDVLNLPPAFLRMKGDTLFYRLVLQPS